MIVRSQSRRSALLKAPHRYRLSRVRGTTSVGSGPIGSGPVGAVPITADLVGSGLGKRSAYSLLEVVMAVGLMAGMLVPSLELIRSGIEVSVETDQRQLLANYASSQVEQRLAITAGSWTTGTFTGDFASDGLSNIRYSTTCSDAAADGGILDTLMIVSSTAYFDANGDDALNSNELSCTYETKLGKFATYEALIP